MDTNVIIDYWQKKPVVMAYRNEMFVWTHDKHFWTIKDSILHSLQIFDERKEIAL